MDGIGISGEWAGTGGAVFAQDVFINEVMSSNGATVKDEDGAFSDWIELHNPGDTAVDLMGWGLTDTASNPIKWSFGPASIQPGEFLVVWASNKNRNSVTNGNQLRDQRGRRGRRPRRPDAIQVRRELQLDRQLG